MSLFTQKAKTTEGECRGVHSRMNTEEGKKGINR